MMLKLTNLNNVRHTFLFSFIGGGNPEYLKKKQKKTAVLPQVTDNLLYKIALDTSYHKQESNSQL